MMRRAVCICVCGAPHRITDHPDRLICRNTGEKIRSIYSELLHTASVDRVGFIRGASATKFNALAQETPQLVGIEVAGGDELSARVTLLRGFLSTAWYS